MVAASVILASASDVRARLLRNAGLQFEVVASDLDEAKIKTEMKTQGKDWLAIAKRLAKEKARQVSKKWPDALVIGADQILMLDSQAFDKPQDLSAARQHLLALSGRTHSLLTAACMVRDGRTIWQHLAQPHLTMRPLSNEFIDAYLEAVGQQALFSVGAYQLEGHGGQLFEKVDGDFFSVLGLPLLDLLSVLRDEGILQT